ncbi:MAG: type II secretion system F family protein [Pseudomonadota bacterium]
MFDPNVIQIIFPIMIALAVGGVAYVFIYPFLSGERKSGQRVKKISQKNDPSANDPRFKNIASGQTRRSQVQDTLKELDARQKAKENLTIRVRLERAGLDLTPNVYYVSSLLLALIVGALIFLSGSAIYVALGAGAAAGIGLPRWVIGFLAKRRQKKFTAEFANAIDIIVRGVKSGLPLNDCLKVIAAETQEPVRMEFVEVVEQLRIGLPISEALEKMYKRMPLEEVNFFAIVISIQQQSGGNLAEALGNLSSILRDRKKLKGKIQAFSAEAKSSAAIIAALPVVVMLLVYITTPDYIALLWEREIGQIMLMGCGVWMAMGVFVMAKMINFDY